MRPHRSLQHSIARVLRKAGAEVDVERVIPEMRGRAQGSRGEADAVMDLYVSFAGSCQRFLLDVSIRCPHAQRYGESHCSPGCAARSGEKEKQDLYGAEVFPVVIESYGRICTIATDAFQQLGVAAAACGRSRIPAGRIAFSLRAAAERAVLYARADVALLALGSHAAAFSTFVT